MEYASPSVERKWARQDDRQEDWIDAVQKEDAKKGVEKAVQPYGGKRASQERFEQRADEGWHPIVGTGVIWPK